MTNMLSIPDDWDLIVVGGGPAGSATAITAAKRGLRVLQVDAKAFPRRKVCGGCLNQVSIGLLKSLVGSEDSVWNAASPVNYFRLMDTNRQFDFPTPTGLVIERSVLDAKLAEAGQRYGVTFAAPVTATLGKSESGFRQVALRDSAASKSVCAKVVVLATGLGSHRGAEPQLQQVAQANSRVGVEGLIRTPTYGLGEEVIHMAVGHAGYVGLTKISDNEVHVAAAVDRKALRAHGPREIVQRILDESGTRRKLGDDISWRGTPALTARAGRLGAERVFLVGDAANYVEPFTGQGILWALKSGIGIAPTLNAAVEDWDDLLVERWEIWHKANIQSEQKLCRQIAFGLKHPSLRWLARQTLRIYPRLVPRIIHRLNTQSSNQEN